MKKSALVTGITGQDGAYLTKFLLGKEYEVYGLLSRRVNQSFENLDFLGVRDKVKFIYGDVTDLASLQGAIDEAQPDEFYNLAAMSFVGSSWQEPVHTSLVNGIGVLNCLEAIKNVSNNTRMYQASTSEMYGLQVNPNGFRNESTPFIPRSPYGVAKLFGHQMVRNYRESYDMFCCSGILFNHESPIRGLEFVTRKITDGVAKIATGKADSITLGNLEAFRDWGFAGDYVEAMWLMLQQEEPDDFVIATGKSHSIKEFLRMAFDHIGITNYDNYIKSDPRYMRPAELDTLKGDATQADVKLKWRPKVDINELVSMMVKADLDRHND
jgi:GDPmannose 4,6-dehydratase